MDLKKQIVELACVHAIRAYSGMRGDNVVAIHNKLTSTTAYVLKTPIFQVVVFAGTNNVHDWLFNLTAIPYRYNKRWCHGGFVMAHKSVWKRIRRQLDPNRRTIVCGHSLGGALAELSAHCMQDFIELHLVTFGKPNVFFGKNNKKDVRGEKNNKQDLSRLKLKTQISFVHGSDVVPRLPRYFYGPDAGQTLVYFDSFDCTHINPSTDFLREDWRFRRAVSDHCMEEYVDLVRGRYLTILPELDETSESGGEGSESVHVVL